MGRGPEPRWLTEDTLPAIHAQQIERFGGAHGALVVLALNRTRLPVEGREPYAITMAVATNSAGDAEVSANLRSRLPQP